MMAIKVTQEKQALELANLTWTGGVWLALNCKSACGKKIKPVFYFYASNLGQTCSKPFSFPDVSLFSV